MSTIVEAVAAADKPACALVIDRLKQVAKSEWAVAKLEGRWPLASGSVLPSTAPIGNDSLRIAAKALALHTSESRAVAPVRVQGLMGLDPKCRLVVSPKDSREQIDLQWSQPSPLLCSCCRPGRLSRSRHGVCVCVRACVRACA